MIQGIGAAVMFPSSLALLEEEFEGPARRRAIGTWGAVIGLAFAAGPLLGGLLAEAAGWRAIFVLNLLLGAPLVWLARFWTPGFYHSCAVKTSGIPVCGGYNGQQQFRACSRPRRRGRAPSRRP